MEDQIDGNEGVVSETKTLLFAHYFQQFPPSTASTLRNGFNGALGTIKGKEEAGIKCYGICAS